MAVFLLMLAALYNNRTVFVSFLEDAFIKLYGSLSMLHSPAKCKIMQKEVLARLGNEPVTITSKDGRLRPLGHPALLL